MISLEDKSALMFSNIHQGTTALEGDKTVRPERCLFLPYRSSPSRDNLESLSGGNVAFFTAVLL